MIYDEDNDYYICANNKKLIRQKDRVYTRKSGFKEVQRVYRCFECNNCPYQKQCNKYSKKDNPQTKSLRYSEEFNKLRLESYENITSEEGIDERLNRSIQAEGMFSKMKEGL
ncbi:transposase, partial [Klebsiella pneumoniae]|uniref:transposase n=1 Tax=Klebsiella pneumoniae TaxID=573 RepID=UPI003A89AD16